MQLPRIKYVWQLVYLYIAFLCYQYFIRMLLILFQVLYNHIVKNVFITTDRPTVLHHASHSDFGQVSKKL